MKTEFEIKAESLVAAGEAKSIDDAFSQVAAADPESYNSYLGTLGGKIVTNVRAAGPSAEGPSMFETQARALVAAGEAKTLDEALGIIGRECPESYNRYLASLR